MQIRKEHTIKAERYILHEGAILGPAYIIKNLKKIIFVKTAEELRFERLLKKDRSRRSFNEICARFLVT